MPSNDPYQATPPRPLPYGLSETDLVPDPSCIIRDHNAVAVTRNLHQLLSDSPWLTSLPNRIQDDQERIFGAGLALAMRMIPDPQYAHMSRGQILAVALDTAIVWERG